MSNLIQSNMFLKRPDMYAGSIENTPRVSIILNSENQIEEKYYFNPGLFKLADETLVNAWDHWQNTQSTASRVRMIKIAIDVKEGLFLLRMMVVEFLLSGIRSKKCMFRR